VLIALAGWALGDDGAKKELGAARTAFAGVAAGPW
jgi:hypothetical protein